MKRFLGAILTLQCLASGCTVGPDYEKPVLSAPAVFESQNVLAMLGSVSKDSIYAELWWEGFGDPILNSIVEEGLQASFALEAAAARVEQAAAVVLSAESGMLPSASGSFAPGLERRKELGGLESDTTTRRLAAGLSASLPLDLFGKLRRQIQAAEADLQAAEAAMQKEIYSVTTNIVRQYLELRGTQKQLQLLQQSLALQEKTLRIVESRYQSGLAPELDVNRARRSVQALRASIPPLEQGLLTASYRLAELTGRYPGAYSSLLQDEPRTPEYQSMIEEVIPGDVLLRHPDVLEAEAELMRAVSEIGIAKADYYPALAIDASLAVSLTRTSGLAPTDLLLSSLSSLIDHVLFDGGRRRAGLEFAEARTKEALANFEASLRQTLLAVEVALSNLQGSLNRQGPLEGVVESSRRSARQAETLYQQGLISFLDVVDAQRVLAEAEQQLAAERTDYARQIATLYETLATSR